MASVFFPVLCTIVFCTLLQGCSPPLAQNRKNRQTQEPPPIRAIQVDLDYVYDPDPEQQQANLDLLIRRVDELGVNTVFLQAFADPDGNGVAENLYFPSTM